MKLDGTHIRRGFMIAGACLLALPMSYANEATFFEQTIRPILVENCLECHSAEKQKGGLRLDTREDFIAGGEHGAIALAGKPDESRLINAVRRAGELKMPPENPLNPKDVEALVHWVNTGAVWPEASLALRKPSSGFTTEERSWWAMQPLREPTIPVQSDDTWSSNPIDRFIYRELVQQKMTPAPRARKAVLIRRAYYDLIGLPPTPEQIEAFIADTSPDAWSTTIDTLLADPRYGEHWARFWLDVVRYAESDGWNKDAYRPMITQYRDYVVKAFNEDKPYPDFVREQIAGDEIGEDNPEDLVATGFLRLGVYEYNQRDARKQWDDIMNEMTDVTSNVFFGLSMSCSRCHDHKFDPILQRDYFSLRAFFEPVIWHDDIPITTTEEQRQWQEQQDIWEVVSVIEREALEEYRQPFYDKKWKSTAEKFPLEIQACFNKPVEERNSWEEQMAYLVTRQYYEEGVPALVSISKPQKAKNAALQEALSVYDSAKPTKLTFAMTVKDFSGPAAPTVIPSDRQATPIEPRFLRILSDDDQGEIPIFPKLPNSTGRRTALAKWIGRADNPLTTRVMVNRIWQQHFTQGLVLSVNDFGHLGDQPTHPELLDWLTNAYIKHDWSAKHLHKLILMSSTWQQSSTHPQATEQQTKDPAESLLWRSKVHRLKAEQLHDAMLMISGELTTEKKGKGARSLYTKVKRNTPDEFLQAFDMANGLTSIAERNSTTTPTQALLLMNGEFTLKRAENLAKRIQHKGLKSSADTLDYAFYLTWGRHASPEELTHAIAFTKTTASGDTPFDKTRLIDFCHALLNSNEFAYVD